MEKITSGMENSISLVLREIEQAMESKRVQWTVEKKLLESDRDSATVAITAVVTDRGGDRDTVEKTVEVTKRNGKWYVDYQFLTQIFMQGW